jgi:hypothetical protein
MAVSQCTDSRGWTLPPTGNRSPITELNWRRAAVVLCWVIAFSMAPKAEAGFIGNYSLGQFSLINTNADGSVTTPDGGLSIILVGGNSGSGLPGMTDLVITAAGTGLVQFSYAYSSLDFPGYDYAGYLWDSTFIQLANTDGQSGAVSFPVINGELFGFRVGTVDNSGEPGILTLSNFGAPAGSGGNPIPEPRTAPILAAGIAMVALRRWMCRGARVRTKALVVVLGGLFVPAGLLLAQSQYQYTGANITGQLARIGTVNALQQSQAAPPASAQDFTGPLAPESLVGNPALRERAFRRPPYSRHTVPLARSDALAGEELLLRAALSGPSLPVTVFNGFGVMGLTHYDQRGANGGNEYSIEPPSPGIAVGNGYILEGVNNAIHIYTTSGTPVLPNVISTNQLFGLAPQINRTTNVRGPNPTDIRVFYDQTLNRWFVLQRALDNDAAGNTLNSSHLYIAVSQTNDPAGTYNIYVMDTTHAANRGCPCLIDYPSVGADQYGFYVSGNEYNTASSSFVDAIILAISKASLANDAVTPVTYQVVIPQSQEVEFTIQPAVTPPDASYYLGNNGLEYFVSSKLSSFGAQLAIWALMNTASLATVTPNLTLFETIVPSLAYVAPGSVPQRPGPLPYGSSLTPPRTVPANIDGGDIRVLSACYSGGRLFATLSTVVSDANGTGVVAVGYAILSPTFRGGVLSARGLYQGYLLVNNNHLLRPAVAVNARGNGVIVFTLVGPDYYPSAALVTFSISATSFSLSPAIQVTAPGLAPEDGFTGYQQGTARWGDWSTAVVDNDGSIWTATEYISNVRSQLANWSTFLAHVTP